MLPKSSSCFLFFFLLKQFFLYLHVHVFVIVDYVCNTLCSICTHHELISRSIEANMSAETRARFDTNMYVRTNNVDVLFISRF